MNHQTTFVNSSEDHENQQMFQHIYFKMIHLFISKVHHETFVNDFRDHG